MDPKITSTEETAPVSHVSRRGSAVGPTISLVIYDRKGAQAMELAPGAPLVVGREPPANVVVRDSNVSRRHARFSLDGGKLLVEDLGSTNGTRVRGKSIRGKVVIRPGEAVQIGTAIASVHVHSSMNPRLGGLESRGGLRDLVERQIDQARFFRERVAVLYVTAAADESGHVSYWCQRVLDTLRPIDAAAMYSPYAIEVLMPRTSQESALQLAGKIMSDAGKLAKLRCGIATFPSAATTSGPLLEAARRAARKAPVGGMSVAEAAAERQPSDPEQPVVVNAAMKKLYAAAERLARTPLAVLILGETGTGKEELARVLHERGPRSAKPMITVNCGAIPQQLVESTLFGHVRGAFTGADRDNKGVFRSADGGTVLLDEIGELPAQAQAALLRVLETRKVTPVGSSEETTVDIRIVAATHCDLDAMCQNGTFRRDLLYRLNTATLDVPPLRQRADEIPELCKRFVAGASKLVGRNIEGVQPDALEALVRNRWPGNIRELKNAIERAAAICTTNRIELEDLPQLVAAVQSSAPVIAEEHPTVGDDDDDLKTRVRRFEAMLIVDALRRETGNQTHAAKRLQVPLRTLVHKLRTLDIRKSAYLDDD